MLDASKAFDRVCTSKLFHVLLKKQLCPVIIRLLFYMYRHQHIKIEWNSYQTNTFTTQNGIKQGAVASPILFTLYIDELFSLLEQSGMGCHVGPLYAGVYAYADDIALVSPSRGGLQHMIEICEAFASQVDIIFNPNKTKLICFNADTNVSVSLGGCTIMAVKSDKHLGNYISNNVHDRNIDATICNFYRKSNEAIADFMCCESQTIHDIHRMFCMDFYGCELWNLNKAYMGQINVAWRNVMRKVWKLPNRTHNELINNFVVNVEHDIHCRMIRFIHNMLRISYSSMTMFQIKNCLSNRSTLAENFRFLCYTYNLSMRDFQSELDILLGKVKMKQSKLSNSLSSKISVMRELISVRDGTYILHSSFDKYLVDLCLQDVCTG